MGRDCSIPAEHLQGRLDFFVEASGGEGEGVGASEQHGGLDLSEKKSDAVEEKTPHKSTG